MRSGSAHQRHLCPAAVLRRRTDAGAPDRNRDEPSASSLEVSRPSGDISKRIRCSRVCLTRHLPSLAFLRPSTGYSSLWIARLVSCRRRPWGSKSRDHLSSASHASFPVSWSSACSAHRSTRVDRLSRFDLSTRCPTKVPMLPASHSSSPSVDRDGKRADEPNTLALPRRAGGTPSVSASSRAAAANLTLRAEARSAVTAGT